MRPTRLRRLHLHLLVRLLRLGKRLMPLQSSLWWWMRLNVTLRLLRRLLLRLLWLLRRRGVDVRSRR
jgi:hypothetical protein